jgi:hypothetical protein
MNYFWTISAIWFLGMIILSIWHGTTATIIGILTSMLWAHLVWGSKWRQGEQEWPPVIEEDDLPERYTPCGRVINFPESKYGWKKSTK